MSQKIVLHKINSEKYHVIFQLYFKMKTIFIIFVRLIVMKMSLIKDFLMFFGNHLGSVLLL